ncbi:MAG: VWA domain-containing protein [Planctomycetes bacterium]|nr:VWA domain-containing protein [Planctomycetota bacterium]
MIPHFTYPWTLLLLLLLPPLAWRYVGRSRGAWRFSDQRLLPALTSTRARLAWWGGLSLRLLTLTLLIVALAGPRWEDPSPIPTEGISIVMIVDVSTSMGTPDFAWENKKLTRLVGVKKVFRLFVAGGKGPDDIELKGRPHDAIALVAFGTHPETSCPLTLEHDALLKMMEKLEPLDDPSKGTTNPGDAIAWALNVLQQAPTRRKVIVFLTDGEANVKKVLTWKQAGHLAALSSVPIYAVDASPAEPKTKEEIEEAKNAMEMLQTLAKMTQGSYFRAQDGRALLAAYENIDRIERERILSHRYRRYLEAFHWFALAALGCGLALIGLEATVWRRAP